MIVLLIGPSGSGKTAVIRKLGYPELISTTSREIRPGEVNGVDYWFISEEEFKQKLVDDEFIEHTIYAGAYYGFLKQDLAKLDMANIHIAAVDLCGVNAIRELFGKSEVLVISIHATAAKLVECMRKRGDQDTKVIKRLVNLVDTCEMEVNNNEADVCIPSTEIPEMVSLAQSAIIHRLMRKNPRK